MIKVVLTISKPTKCSKARKSNPVRAIRRRQFLAQVDVVMDLDRKFEDIATSSTISLGKTKRENHCHKDKDYSQAKKRLTVPPFQSTAITAAAITPVERKYHAKEHSSLLDVVKPLVGQARASDFESVKTHGA